MTYFLFLCHCTGFDIGAPNLCLHPIIDAVVYQKFLFTPQPEGLVGGGNFFFARALYTGNYQKMLSVCLFVCVLLITELLLDPPWF